MTYGSILKEAFDTRLAKFVLGGAALGGGLGAALPSDHSRLNNAIGGALGGAGLGYAFSGHNARIANNRSVRDAADNLKHVENMANAKAFNSAISAQTEAAIASKGALDMLGLAKLRSMTTSQLVDYVNMLKVN